MDPTLLPATEGLLRQTGAEVLLPTDQDYRLRQDSYFSRTAAQLSPAYIVRPSSASQVSSAVCALVSKGLLFAVRSGGHGPEPRASNIDGGVTLDLGLLNWTKVVETAQSAQDEEDDAPLVDIGPGALWRDVYAELDKRGLVVPGGREGSVGVGGLVLGGGITFLTSRRGFACDNVVVFEVVLADGRIVQATETSSPDLFWALKGGSNNFGIVTNIRMQALRSRPVWGALTLSQPQMVPQVAEAMVEFTGRAHEDLDSNLLCMIEYRPETTRLLVRGYLVQVAGVDDSPVYSRWMSLPAIHSSTTTTSFAEITGQNSVPDGYR